MKKKTRNIILIAVVAAVGVAALAVALHGSRKATFKQDFHIADIQHIGVLGKMQYKLDHGGALWKKHSEKTV